MFSLRRRSYSASCPPAIGLIIFADGFSAVVEVAGCSVKDNIRPTPDILLAPHWLLWCPECFRRLDPSARQVYSEWPSLLEVN